MNPTNKLHRLTILVMMLVSIALGAELSPTAAQTRSCPGAPPLHFTVGMRGQVVPTPPGQSPSPIRIRLAPGRNGKILGQLSDGDTFKVIDGPICTESYAWWKVQTDAGLEGWVAEGDATSYFIEPLQTTSALPTGSPTPPLPSAPTGTPTRAPTATLSPITPISPESGAAFAAFAPGNVNTTGQVAPYQIASDFSNVLLAAALTRNQLDFLQRNGFVVSPGDSVEFQSVYSAALRNVQPLFITSDSLLHSFHLLFDKVLRTAEVFSFAPLLRDLNRGLLVEADRKYQALKGTDWEDAARNTVAFVGVSAKLVDDTVAIPDYASAQVAQELASINNAAGIGPSAVFPTLDNGEDWSQYRPRGHYTRSDTLKAYFRAMIYYGRMTFRLSKPDETKSALLLAAAIRDANVNGRRGTDAWADLYAPTVFFVGKSDSLTIPQYVGLMDQIYGPNASIQAIQSKGIDPFVAAAQALPSPRVLSAIVYDNQNVEQETKGLRFMGQRFVWDAYVFSQLLYRKVGTSDKPRTLPMALDVFAAMGSDRALQILDKEGATGFQNYVKQMGSLKNQTASLTESDWTETLYNAWLFSLNTLAQPLPVGYPSFMTNPAYTDRTLFAALGSYAELKHDTILYAQQAVAGGGGGGGIGKGPPPEPVLPPNYVEPVPLFWARLAALAEMSLDGLGSRNLLNADDRAALTQIAIMARNFEAYAIKELNNQPLSADQQDSLREYATDLNVLLIASLDKVDENGPPAGPANPSGSIIADIATDPNGKGRVLEIGTGRVFDIYAAVPIDGKLYLAHGAVFSYYEFAQPLSKRLTDDDWLKLLDTGKTPPLPDWTFSFLSKDAADPAFSTAVRDFQQTMVLTLWVMPGRDYDRLRTETDGVSRFLTAQLKPLADAQQYEGRQIIQTNFLSLDFAANGKTATIKTRETWRGELHNNGPTEDSDGPKVGQRGPYTIDVTYTFTRDQSGEWQVADVAVSTPLPAWTPIAPS